MKKPTTISKESVSEYREFVQLRLRKRVLEAIEVVLEEEVNQALGCGSYERAEDRRGYRNGAETRRVTTSVGTRELRVPRARVRDEETGETTEFRSELLPRYARRTREVDEAILGTYLSGANSRRIRKALKPLLGEEHLSKSAVSRVVSRLKERFEEWQNRALSEEVYAIVYLDGFHLKVRMAKRVISVPVLVALGVAPDGAQTSVVIASGGERNLDALGLRAGGTPGSRTPGSQASDQRRPQGADESAGEVAGVPVAAMYRAQARRLARTLPGARTP